MLSSPVTERTTGQSGHPGHSCHWTLRMRNDYMIVRSIAISMTIKTRKLLGELSDLKTESPKTRFLSKEEFGSPRFHDAYQPTNHQNKPQQQVNTKLMT